MRQSQHLWYGPYGMGGPSCPYVRDKNAAFSPSGSEQGSLRPAHRARPMPPWPAQTLLGEASAPGFAALSATRGTKRSRSPSTRARWSVPLLRFLYTRSSGPATHLSVALFPRRAAPWTERPRRVGAAKRRPQ